MKKYLSLVLALVCMVSLPLFIFVSADATYAVTLDLPHGRTEDDLWLIYDEEAFPDLNAIPAGEQFVFTLGYGERIDPYYTNIYIDGEVFGPQPDGNYVLPMDKDYTIECPLHGGENFRIKTFSISNPQDDGYRVRPPHDLGWQNYRVEWGGDYTFRVILLEGYEGAYIEDDYENSRLIVKVKYETEIDGKMKTVTLNVGDEGFEFVGTDVDGSPLFKLTNITHNMEVVVSSLQSDTFSSVISWMMRILRLLVNLITGGETSGLFDSFEGIFDNFTGLFENIGDAFRDL